MVHFDDIQHRTSEDIFRNCAEIVRNAPDDIIVEGVYGTRKRRAELLRASHGKKVCIWLDTPVDVCIARENRNRPTAIITIHAHRFEPPTLDEGWDEIRIVRYTE